MSTFISMMCHKYYQKIHRGPWPNGKRPRVKLCERKLSLLSSLNLQSLSEKFTLDFRKLEKRLRVIRIHEFPAIVTILLRNQNTCRLNIIQILMTKGPRIQNVERVVTTWKISNDRLVFRLRPQLVIQEVVIIAGFCKSKYRS